MPGETNQLWVFPRRKKDLSPVSVGGEAGQYKVQFLLGRPGYPLTAENEQSFIDKMIGDSHVQVAKPKLHRKPEDIDEVILDADVKGDHIQFKALVNDKGFLGKLVVESITANGFRDAEHRCHQAVSPILSAWSLTLDIPIHVETIQTTELRTHQSSLRVVTPTLEMSFVGSFSKQFTEEFRHYASLYREGLSSNSNFYRFLCFYKIGESILALRGRKAKEAITAGQPVRRFKEMIPTNIDEQVLLLKQIYPWRKTWDRLTLEQLLPDEARGKKMSWVLNHLKPLRTGMAHALLDSGESRVTLDKLEDIQEVNKWLPLLRVVSRVFLRNEFPKEFAG